MEKEIPGGFSGKGMVMGWEILRKFSNQGFFLSLISFILMAVPLAINSVTRPRWRKEGPKRRPYALANSKFFIFLILFLTCFISNNSSAGGNNRVPDLGEELLHMGPHEVGYTSITLTDNSRGNRPINLM